jgi:hypothetical protein
MVAKGGGNKDASCVGNKDLRKIFGAKKDGNEWKIGNNQALRNMYVWTTRNNWRYQK